MLYVNYFKVNDKYSSSITKENIMDFFANVKVMVKLLPSVIEAIDTVEKLFPDGGKGEQKLELVKNMLKGANDNAKTVLDFEALWPLLSITIASIVKSMNIMKPKNTK